MNICKSAALLAAVGAVSMAIANAASAQSFTSATNTAQALDLDSAAGSFSVWRATDLTGVNAAHIRFDFPQMRSDPKWAPGFHYALQSGDEIVQITFVGSTKTGPIMVGTLEHLKGGKTVSSEDFLMPINASEECGLDIDWSPANEVAFHLKCPEMVKVSPTGETHKATMSSAPTAFQISGSTGELEVKSLQLGHLTP
ncbi:MAG TPA: hypothetical protein VGL66_09830 [Caulobacteraceae bacterium]|jgi:hypothetical protein